MHTWGSNLLYHPHIHTLSTCGRLDTEHNRHTKKDGFFLPGKAMARFFKGKFLYGLMELHDAGRFLYEGEAAVYRNSANVLVPLRSACLLKYLYRLIVQDQVYYMLELKVLLL